MGELSHEALVWIAVVGVGLFAMVRYLKRSREKLVPEGYVYGYDFFAEPAARANRNMVKAFADRLDRMDEETAERVHLIRFLVMNRGGLTIAAADHRGPLLVTFPAGAHLVEARFAEAFGFEPDRPPEMTVGPRAFSLAPFDLPVNTALVFNLIVEGADAPETVEGGLDGQPEIGRIA